MSTRKSADMTQGPILSLITAFALPIMLGNVAQLFYSTADTMVVGNYCGRISLAAVGTSSQPLEIFMCVFMGIGAGVSILISRYAGGGNIDRLRTIADTACSFICVVSIPLSIIGIALTPAIVRMMQVPLDTRAAAECYIRIVFLGLIGNMGYNMNAGILRGLGDSKSSLIFLILSGFVNVGLDLLFIAVFQMDVAGAALATAFSMYASWLSSVSYLRAKYPSLEISVLPRRFDRDAMREIAAIGLPLGFNNSIFALGHIAMQSLLNLQGSAYMAGAAVSGKLTGVSNVAITSYASAMSTFSGQNYGAGRNDRLWRGGRLVPLCAGAVTFVMGMVIFLFAEPLVRLFTDDPDAVANALLHVRWILPFQWCYCVLNTIGNLANGMGEVKYTTVVNVLMLWAVRIPCAYLIAYLIDGKYCMVATSVSFLFGMCAMLPFYRSKRWRAVAVQCRAAVS